ncbi:beta-ketoacyl-[acyl-carrier-protein] synthase family protein [Pseudomonas mangrovi]|uniref:Beta-ketoacyl-[acyl-carrier-protein] synthase II n=1 Tax=Pseudomonas mangrovi TaxID=2161748 RepID=A0A2T5P584_9PSED|nr:beta-ketoacyl-[acyl-carrier-protein] synthase family protein [Pseudomonas mangrovi]PTU72893.1 beta-ketoacyl-[acyl-carrier-protein] synthase II [Pseudomonas mangrovi]
MSAILDALGLVCALGQGREAVAAALAAGDRSGMRGDDRWVSGRQMTVGAVPGELPPLPPQLADQDTRNNRLLLAAARQIEPALQAAVQRYGRGRIGVVLGTSTSGIEESSQGIASLVQQGQLPSHYSYLHQELVAPASLLGRWLGIDGPCYSISTACTSSAKALQNARRLLRQGVCDAVVCGGVDSLARLTLNGFAALEAVSDGPCNPFSVNRQGINIGEAAALFLMTREPIDRLQAPITLLGAGSTSDAHHISAPEPSGRGAREAMLKALDDANLAATQIDYLNLHGTATLHNDAMESLAVAAVFPAGVPCSSTKPLTGHTLGAAGALEAAFCWLSLASDSGRLPPHLWDGQADPALPPLRLTGPGQRLGGAGPRRMMSNSFAFGGSNVSLILGDLP